MLVTIEEPGENAGYQYFLFSSMSFIAIFLSVDKTHNCMVKVKLKTLTLYHTIMTLNDPEKALEEIPKKKKTGENAGNQQFLFFPTMISNLKKILNLFKAFADDKSYNASIVKLG